MTHAHPLPPNETLATEVLKIAATLTQARMAWDEYLVPGRDADLTIEQQFHLCFRANIILALQEREVLLAELSTAQPVEGLIARLSKQTKSAYGLPWNLPKL